jgi:hydrogenase maturation protein HypF
MEELEALARRSADTRTYPVDLQKRGDCWVLRVGPVLAAVEKDLYRGTPPAAVARRFHATAAGLIREALVRVREESGLAEVVLCGRVFGNAILLADTLRVLGEERFRVYRPRTSPGAALCLGQLAVAAVGGGRRASGPAPCPPAP